MLTRYQYIYHDEVSRLHTVDATTTQLRSWIRVDINDWKLRCEHHVSTRGAIMFSSVAMDVTTIDENR